MQAYSDPSRENEPHALPDVEVFYADRGDWWTDDNGERVDAQPCGAGWYWWSCFPGCMPDSDPSGPFATEAEALAEAQADADCG